MRRSSRWLAVGLIVTGLDCLDGTPLVDIKPYLPSIDQAATAEP
jgi:tRNA (Thr-GGU) A37 N-methylase